MEADSPTSIAITWDPPLPQAQNGIIRHYTIFIAAEQLWVNYSQELVLSETTELNVTGLRPFVTYQIQMNAYTISPGPLSRNYTVTTLETGEQGLHTRCNYIH